MLRALGLCLARPLQAPIQDAVVLRPATTAAFTVSAFLPRKAMPPRPKPPPEEDMEEYFIHGSGPGGQKINKTASAVQLKHIPTGIVVKSQATRSREQNRKIARELLAERLDVLDNGDKSRKLIVEGFKKKRADSSSKKSRRKYRKLDEEKEEKEEKAKAEADGPLDTTSTHGENSAESQS